PTSTKINLGGFTNNTRSNPNLVNDLLTIKDRIFSIEFCGGPHVRNTSELAENGKKFKILKEESSGSGIRRIKASLV
ncbi:partial Alanine--tRNA ligase, partial [Patescibacteria group bacterium]